MSSCMRTFDVLRIRPTSMETIRAKTRAVERIKARLSREKQFNKRVAINAELRAASQELASLEQGSHLTADRRRHGR